MKKDKFEMKEFGFSSLPEAPSYAMAVAARVNSLIELTQHYKQAASAPVFTHKGMAFA